MADKVADKKTKPNFFARLGKGISRFFREYKSEVKKITWPDFKTVVKSTVVVLIVVLVIGAGIWLVDWVLTELISLVKPTL